MDLSVVRLWDLSKLVAPEGEASGIMSIAISSICSTALDSLGTSLSVSDTDSILGSLMSESKCILKKASMVIRTLI